MTEETTGSGSELTVTQTTTQEPSSTTVGGNEGGQSNTETAPRNWEQSYKDSSREAVKLAEEKRQLESQLEESRKELLDQITKDRNTYENYVKTKTTSPEELKYYMDIYDTKLAPNKLTSTPTATGEGQTTQQATGMVPPVQPVDPARQSWMNRLDNEERERLEAQTKATRDFFDRDENANLPKAVQDSIRATAAMLDQEYGYAPADALAAARKRLLDPEAIKNEGYAQGVKDSMTGGFSRGIYGGSAQPDNSIKLPEKDEAFVQMEIARKNLSGKEAEDFRKRYAERLARRNS
jgi:hypothetical protein